MKRSPLLRRVALLCIAGLLGACERVYVESTNTLDRKPQASGAAQALSGGQSQVQGIVQRIAGAREQTLFQGLRHVELFFEIEGVQRRVDMRERVTSDGQGAFSIEAIEVNEPVMQANQQAVFFSLQSLRQGMNWRYRDFGIHHVDLFLQNYTLTDTGITETIAGCTVNRYTVERIDDSGSVYSIGVDSVSALVLHAREESQEGVLISEMTYESLELQPNLSAVVWHQSVNDEASLPETGRLEPHVGFEPRAPRTLPPGFQLLARARITDPLDGSLWVKATFTDGVESLFYVHGGPIVNGNGIRSGVPEIQADLVEVTAVAPWTIARGNLRGERVLALGKVPEADLLLLVRSAME